MTISDSDREILGSFIESVEELLDSRFLAQSKADGMGTSVSWSKAEGLVALRTGSDREAVKAFLLTLRFFCQDNEKTSLSNMEKRISAMAIGADIKDRFHKSRTNFNAFLGTQPSVQFPPGAGAATRQDIFETFLYGEFAHANPEKRRRVRSWEKELYYKDLQVQFDLILIQFLNALTAMASACEAAGK